MKWRFSMKESAEKKRRKSTRIFCLLFIKLALSWRRVFYSNKDNFVYNNTSLKRYNSVEPLPTFNWVFQYQLIASEILTQPSLYKIECNLQLFGLCIYIFKFIVLTFDTYYLVYIILNLFYSLIYIWKKVRKNFNKGRGGAPFPSPRPLHEQYFIWPSVNGRGRGGGRKWYGPGFKKLWLYDKRRICECAFCKAG